MNSCFKYCGDQIDRRYPFTLIDVGAMGGIQKKWDPLLSLMRIVAFEPDAREFSKLKNSDRVMYLNYILSDSPKDLPFYISRGQGKSSIFRPNTPFLSQFPDSERFETVEEKSIPASQMRKLDAMMSENSIEDIDFIKLDTEGSELFILEGGKQEVLPCVFGIHIEVAFAALRKNQFLFHEVDKFLIEQGFQLMDLRRTYWKRKDYYNFPGKGQLIFGVALYFKKIDVFIQELEKNDDRVYQSSKIYKSVLACMIYRAFDYAMSLSNIGFEKGFLTDSDFRELTKTIQNYARQGNIPNFWGRTFIYKVLNRICEKIRPASYLGWADADRWISNIKDI